MDRMTFELIAGAAFTTSYCLAAECNRRYRWYGRAKARILAYLAASAERPVDVERDVAEEVPAPRLLAVEEPAALPAPATPRRALGRRKAPALAAEEGAPMVVTDRVHLH